MKRKNLAVIGLVAAALAGSAIAAHQGYIPNPFVGEGEVQQVPEGWTPKDLGTVAPLNQDTSIPLEEVQQPPTN